MTDTVIVLDEMTDTVIALDERTDTDIALDERTDTDIALDKRTDTVIALDERTDTVIALDERTDTDIALDKRYILLFECWVFFVIFIHLLTCFKINFFKNSFRKTIRVSNGLDPDQDQCFVQTDLGTNCLHRLAADNKICRWQAKS